jgi:hypothetical protein
VDWLRGLIWLESAVEGNEGESEREMLRVWVRGHGAFTSSFAFRGEW